MKKSESVIADEFCSLYCQLDTLDQRSKFLSSIQPTSFRLHTLVTLLDKRCDTAHLSQQLVNHYFSSPVSLRKILHYYFFLEPLLLHPHTGIHSSDNYVEFLSVLKWLLETYISLQNGKHVNLIFFLIG